MTDSERPEKPRSALYLLLGAVALLLIPVVVGFVMANTGGGGEDESGMSGSDTTRIGTTTTSAAQAPGTNLALQASITGVSSEFSDAFAAANAIDGSLSTEWSSRGDGNDAYIVIDLGAATDITGFGFRTREMTDGTAITNTYTVTIDGETVGPFEAGPGLTVTEYGATGQEFRFDMEDTTGGNTGAVEIEIYDS